MPIQSFEEFLNEGVSQYEHDLTRTQTQNLAKAKAFIGKAVGTNAKYTGVSIVGDTAYAIWSVGTLRVYCDIATDTSEYYADGFQGAFAWSCGTNRGTLQYRGEDVLYTKEPTELAKMIKYHGGI